MSDLLTIWWEKDNEQRRNKMVSQYPLPYDGASWAIMVNFFGVVGMADARYQVTYVNPEPIILKLFELWPRIKPTHEKTTKTTDHEE